MSFHSLGSEDLSWKDVFGFGSGFPFWRFVLNHQRRMLLEMLLELVPLQPVFLTCVHQKRTGSLLAPAAATSVSEAYCPTVREFDYNLVSERPECRFIRLDCCLPNPAQYVARKAWFTIALQRPVESSSWIRSFHSHINVKVAPAF